MGTEQSGEGHYRAMYTRTVDTPWVNYLAASYNRAVDTRVGDGYKAVDARAGVSQKVIFSPIVLI